MLEINACASFSQAGGNNQCIDVIVSEFFLYFLYSLYFILKKLTGCCTYGFGRRLALSSYRRIVNNAAWRETEQTTAVSPALPLAVPQD